MNHLLIFFEDNYARYDKIERLIHVRNRNNIENEEEYDNDKEEYTKEHKEEYNEDNNEDNNEEYIKTIEKSLLLMLMQQIVSYIEELRITNIDNITDDLAKIVNHKIKNSTVVKTKLDDKLVTNELTTNNVREIYTLYLQLLNDYQHILVIVEYIKSNQLSKPKIDLKSTSDDPLGSELSTIVIDINIDINNMKTHYPNFDIYYDLHDVKVMINNYNHVYICDKCSLPLNSTITNPTKCTCKKSISMINRKPVKKVTDKLAIDEHFKENWHKYHTMLPEVAQVALFNKHNKKNMSKEEVYKKIGHEMWFVILHNRDIDIYKNIYDIHIVNHTLYINNI
jgi:hypothetical protein